MVPQVNMYLLKKPFVDLEILEGKHDDLPEHAFLYVGTIDEAVEKAKKG